MHTKTEQIGNVRLALITFAATVAGFSLREATKDTLIDKVRNHSAVQVLHSDTPSLSNINGPSLDRGNLELNSK